MSGGSIRSKRVIDVLSKLISVHGAPRYLRSHNGPDFVSLALLQRAKDERLESVLSELGKPWQNVTNEGVNGKFRDECLVIAWIRNCLEASPRVTIPVASIEPRTWGRRKRTLQPRQDGRLHSFIAPPARASLEACCRRRSINRPPNY